MSQQIQEQLSALMDGELSRDETLFLMRRVAHDGGLVQRWSAYHVIRQSLQRQEILPLRADFSSVILQQIAAEAAPTDVRRAPWLRWASGGAIAASVAVAALVATSPGQRNAPEGQPLAATPSASVAAPDLTADFRPPMLSPVLDAQPASAGGFSTSSAPIDPRLQSYLIRHYDATGGAGQQALMPYVLLVVPTQSPQAAASPPADGRAGERR
jgi:sigma-E factor negative regulatory protein RseA